jgi:Flp pilus assembly protein TadD
MKTNVQVSLQQAATALNQGDLRRAATLCRQVLESNPGSVDALNLMSLVFKRGGDAVQAERLMLAALDLAPGRADIRANLGNLYVAMRRRGDAETAYRQALQAQPGFRPARLGLARLLLDLGRAEDAHIEAQVLVDRDARDAEAWNVLGTALKELDRAAEAERALRTALDIRPNYTVARHNLGSFLVRLSRSEEALEELERAAAEGLRGPEIAHNRASALMSLGRFDDTEKLLLEGLAESPHAVSLHMLFARLRYMRGDAEFAHKLREAVTANPDAASLRVACSQILRGAELLDDALEVMEAGFERDNPDPRLLPEMSALRLDRDEYEQGLELARQSVSTLPEDPGLEELVIQALLSLGRGDEAMPLIERARRRAPLDQSYIALEAMAARLMGDPRYEQLYDYERFVQPYELPVPSGWSSIEEFHNDLIPVLVDRHQFVAPPLDQSLRRGTQTPRGLRGDPNPVIQAFLETINIPIGEYCRKMGSDPGHPLSVRNTGKTRLIGCWSVRLSREGFHVNHVHSEGWISSAYYVEVPEEVKDEEAQSGWIKFGEPKFYVPDAHPEKIVQPAAGRLVLFPSYMWHGTTPIHGDEPRMTIAFDVVPDE